MKKLCTLLAFMGLAIYSQAQTVDGGDMENWKSYTSSSTAMERPESWFTSDSLIRFYYFATGGPSTYTPRVSKSTTVKHGGAMSAKLESTSTDTLPTILANSNISFKLSDIIAGKYDFKYLGGTAVTKRIVSAEAWIQFATTSADEGVMSVQALKLIGSVDSVVGKGTVNIPAGSGFSKITTPITYVDATVVPERLVISFIPSKSKKPADGNVMYVDDVTITAPSGIQTPLVNDDRFSAYPNPATNFLHISARDVHELLHINIYTISGQSVISRPINAEEDVDISSLVPGSYIYVVSAAEQGTKFYSATLTKQ